MSVHVKRVYEADSPLDGRRYLVDRLWPRGIGRAQLNLTGWLKDLAPSPELREWFGHDPQRYAEFRRRYLRELAPRTDLVDRLAEEARQEDVTLLFAARDPAHCNASVLRELIDRSSRGGVRARSPPRAATGDGPRGGRGAKGPAPSRPGSANRRLERAPSAERRRRHR